MVKHFSQQFLISVYFYFEKVYYGNINYEIWKDVVYYHNASLFLFTGESLRDCQNWAFHKILQFYSISYDLNKRIVSSIINIKTMFWKLLENLRCFEQDIGF